MDINIQHLEDQRKFLTVVDEHKAFVEYLRIKSKIIFTHTEVARELEGKGIGGALAKHVLEYAKANELVVMPLCPFIAAYISRHPEYKSLLMPGVNV